MHAQNTNRTTMGNFSKFNLLRDHCMLELFLPLLTSLYTPDVTRCVKTQYFVIIFLPQQP